MHGHHIFQLADIMGNYSSFKNTVSSDETNGNVDVKFSPRASPNIESKVIEGEGSGNVPVTHEITLPKTRTIPKTCG